MEKGSLFLFLLIAPNHCLPLLKDNALDLENDAMLYDEAAAKEAGTFHCILYSLHTVHESYSVHSITSNISLMAP
jgi:hypothetical protein